MALHETQAEPPEPHLLVEGVVQAAALQQPLGQLSPSHAPPTHTPPLHVWPEAHEGLVPQRH